MLQKQYFQSLKNIPEVSTPVFLGKVPKNLKGIYVQNGPGEFYLKGHLSHPFDGDGYIRKIEFKDGEAYYQGRYIQTWQRSMEQICQRRLFSGAFGTPPLYTVLKNPVNTNVVFLNEAHLAASSEMGKTYLLDIQTLETLGTYLHTISAHSHQGVSVERDYRNGQTKLTFTDSVDIHVALPNFVYFHDFALTPNYILFMDHGLSMDVWKGVWEGWVNGLTFEEQPTVLYWVHRTTGDVTSIELDVTGFSYHCVCAKETEDLLEIYYILYPTFFSTPSEECQGKLMRTQVNLNNHTQTTQVIHPIWMEMPVYDSKKNECFVILPDRQGFGRLNLTTHRLEIYSEPGKIFNEPFYEENYVMTLVYDVETHGTELYIFQRSKPWKDPKRLSIPISIPMGLHGSYQPAI